MGIEDARGVDKTVPFLDIGISWLWKVEIDHAEGYPDPHRGQFRKN